MGACSTGTVTVFVLENDDDGNAGPTSCYANVGQPINITNGNMYLQQTDYQLPGVGESLQVTRTYNSGSQRINLFGRGWSTQYDESLKIYSSTFLRLYLPDGRAVYFNRGGTGTFVPVEAPDFRGQIVQNADSSYTLSLKDGSIHRFNSAGRLTSLTDRDNNQTVLTYDANGKLVSITDPFGRILTVTTNASGRVLSIGDSLGTIATYTYGASNELLSVTYADNSRF